MYILIYIYISKTVLFEGSDHWVQMLDEAGKVYRIQDFNLEMSLATNGGLAELCGVGIHFLQIAALWGSIQRESPTVSLKQKKTHPTSDSRMTRRNLEFFSAEKNPDSAAQNLRLEHTLASKKNGNLDSRSRFQQNKKTTEASTAGNVRIEKDLDQPPNRWNAPR